MTNEIDYKHNGNKHNGNKHNGNSFNKPSISAHDLINDQDLNIKSKKSVSITKGIIDD